MSTEEKVILEDFGRNLIEFVRDKTIKEIDLSLEENLLGCEFFHKKCFSEEMKEILQLLTPITVDMAIHYLLFLFEGTPDLNLIENTPSGPVSIKQISDGLSGEIYTENGWVVRLSKQRYSKDAIYFD